MSHHPLSFSHTAGVFTLVLAALSTFAHGQTYTNTTSGVTVNNTILVFARDNTSSYSATSGLAGYGIPYQIVYVPSAGITLPTLNTSITQGVYGGILVLSEVSYDYGSTWASALTSAQWQQLFNYQTAFGVRMVRIDVYPEPDYGVQPAIAGAGCCGSGVEQYISISNNSGFPTANIKLGANLSTQGIWHYPATIIDPATTWEVASWAPSSDGTFSNSTTAAVINQYGSRQQMIWFTSWATQWSLTSNYLQHIYINWLTRGLTVGRRRIYLNTQVDDVHLTTALYQPSDGLFRLRASDLQGIATWIPQLNTRIPAGSNYFMELGHNGNGNVQAAVVADNSSVCSPHNAIVYTGDMSSTALEYVKPLGTGTDIWPTTPTSYGWSLACSKLDSLFAWFAANSTNLNSYAHVSHTFTHESLDNATYNDSYREISFNQQWLNKTGISLADKFSTSSLIPPAITGMHNGDSIRAWMDRGIVSAMGDNTRASLLNTQNEFWPRISTVAADGYDGLVILPRWATTIFYNCDLPACTLAEWINTSGGTGNFSNQLADARSTNVRHLLGLHHDPYMFHQANLRQSDTNTTTVGSQTGQFSLIQMWIETVTQEMTRLTNWPILSLKQDDIAAQFSNRMTLDKCNPNLGYSYSSDGKTITSVTVTADGNTCAAPVPVMFPGDATSSNGSITREQLGSDPLVIWVQLTGSPVTLTLSSPVSVL